MKCNTLLTAHIENKTDLFDAIKKQRRTKRAYLRTMDGRTEDIPDYLATTYRSLYNCTDDEKKLTSIHKTIDMKIGDHSWVDIIGIT